MVQKEVASCGREEGHSKQRASRALSNCLEICVARVKAGVGGGGGDGKQVARGQIIRSMVCHGI